uniref:Calvin cycle protein CP12-3ic-like n=1 Tax=Rhizophora mucronata TaxID=61149 RepID=A0A2P2QQ42_RHIMU
MSSASLTTTVLSSSISPRSDGHGFPGRISRSLVAFRKNSHSDTARLMVTAAIGGGGGVAKFKGTQMRERKLTEMIEKKVIEAKEVCEGDETSDECKVAWDEVEEVSQAKADLRLKLEKQQDPLLYYCQDHPETDECRIYED